MKIISFSLPDELAVWLNEYANFNETSRSYIIREMIKQLKRSVEYYDSDNS